MIGMKMKKMVKMMTKITKTGKKIKMQIKKMNGKKRKIGMREKTEIGKQKMIGAKKKTNQKISKKNLTMDLIIIKSKFKLTCILFSL